MDAPTASRLALMSIRPQFADAIFEGTKRIEFRKRRLAPDINLVVVYATMPVGMVVGIFALGGYDVDRPSLLWKRHRGHTGITRSDFDEYYRGTRLAVGLLVEQAQVFDEPISLAGVQDGLRPPQSFMYLDRTGPVHQCLAGYYGKE